MPFKKGDPKQPGAGRPKGSKNKKRVPLVTEYLASRGINPIAEMLKIIPTLETPEQKLKAWQNLTGHTQPKIIEQTNLPSASSTVPESDAPSAQLLSIVKQVPPK